MFTNNKLSKAVRLAVAFGAASVAFSSVAQEAASEEEAKDVERIEVTGSRIKRTDLEGSLPITTIDRAAIDMSGQLSVTDLLRNTTFNSFGSNRTTSGNAAQGTSEINLRGLGANRTLILIDGKRVPKSPLTGSSQDLNQLPLAAVERIEVLQDGASAVYGSDAIGGVINIITRKDYDGAEIKVGTSRVSIPSEGGDREEGSFLIGSANDKTNLMAGFSWNNRDIIFERAFPWVASQRGLSPYGNNWADLTSTGRVPSATAAKSISAGCDFELYYTATNPWIGGDMCSYDFLKTNANDSSTGNQSLFLRGTHEFTDNWKVYGNANVAKTKSFGRYAASLNDPGSILTANSPNNPTNPNSPLYDASIGGAARSVAVFHRFAALGTRDTQVDNYSNDVMVGFEGNVNDIDIDVGVRKAKTKAYNIGTGYLLRSAANIAMESGAYMLNDPFGERFTDPAAQAAHRALLNSMNVTISRISQFDQEEAFASAAFDVMELEAGAVQTVVGAEYRKEQYKDKYDALSEAGVVGGSAGSSAGGGRDVKSAYFETLVPVAEQFELNFAGRYEKYSDYGNDFAPKVSARYEPLEGLVLRGSVGKGFNAPSLDILTQQPSPGNPTVQDFVLCDRNNTPVTACPSGQIRTTDIANPELKSEQSDQMSFGIAYQPTDWLNFAVDYYNIEIEDSIRYIGLQTLINRERAGDSIPAGLGVVRDPVTGAIMESTTGSANDGTEETSGIDVNIATNFDFGNFGKLKSTFQASHVFDYSLDGGRNLVKDPGSPQRRISLNHAWSISDFDVSFTTNVIGSQFNNVTTANNVTSRTGHIASWTTHDLQVVYHTGWNADITVGAQNLFEKFPQIGVSSAAGRNLDYTLYDAYGRVSYVRYTQRF
ncbi:outer membrane cobalamin receptor protein [Rheinheimera sp. A13L]|uniref:TonB-dependent receptor plug domain-containing protein n=1 Tax=Rheinheimera sp. A13L TaxID=506534 RepID=UPI0002124839|nr:TonB-dependent receptor [Rheinheimera sp. A13L]EGM78943.1 outer membrane cobalamin receptor protein [Rheinheimera sp. A13L]